VRESADLYHISPCSEQSSISSLTSRSKEGILIAFAVCLQHRLSGLLEHILVVERDLEWCLWGFVSWCFGPESFHASIERFSGGTDGYIAHRVLLIMCCECSHDDGYIERGVVVSALKLRPVVRRC
jgi:hypothetical protein